jgi:phage FluMu protein Com
MPIRFRCGYCNRLLGIARRKAGTETTCPHCGYAISVPEADDKTELQAAANMDEIDSLLNPESATVADSSPPPPPPTAPRADRPRPAPSGIEKPITAPAVRPAPATPKTSPTPAAVPAPATAPKPHPSGERPLFERDVDAVLGAGNRPLKSAPDTRPKLPATSGMDANNLGPEPGQIVLSRQTAAALAVAVIVLLALSFAAGFLIVSR